MNFQKKQLQLKKAIIGAIALCLLSATHCFAKPYQLSERTLREFKTFSEMQADMDDMKSVANIILSIAPFQSLLDGIDPADTVEISQQPWNLFGKASQGLSSHYRKQLKLFCELEALSQRTSKDDFNFWKNLAEQL